MADKVSKFRSAADEDAFLRSYGEVLEQHWPDVAIAEVDLPSRFGTTHVRRTGSAGGVPIVMVHPTMGGSLGLAPFVEVLAGHRTVYTPDTIGTPGRSAQTAPVSSGEELAEWLDTTMDGLGLERVHLVGYSEGGYVACLCAALTGRSDRLATVTLIEPGGAIGDIRKSTLAGIMWSGVRVMLARDKRAAMRRVGRSLNGDGAYEMPDDMLDLVLQSVTKFQQRIPRPAKLSDDQLRQITAPTHLLLGERSSLYDAAAIVDRARLLLPDVTTYIEPGGGHGFGYDDPASTMKRVLNFIDEHE